jgi:ABC-2 type transport system permease protein
MRETLALMRASWLTASSYKLSMIMSLGGLVLTILPLYFIAGALQPVMADRIGGEGGHYFGFLVVGMLALSLLAAAVNGLPRALGSGIGNGTLEAMLATRARLPAILAGMIGYGFAWTALRGAVALVLAVVLGARLSAEHSVLALGILLLIVAASLPIGLLAGAMILAFRTPGPLPQLALLVSGLLGGVYYPTSAIPSWIQSLSHVVPLTYGLRALRRVWLEGASLGDVASDVGILAAIAVVLFAVGSAVFALALRHARRAGTLAHY